MIEKESLWQEEGVLYTQRHKSPALYIYRRLRSASHVRQLHGAKFGASSEMRLIGLETRESVKLALSRNQKPVIPRPGRAGRIPEQRWPSEAGCWGSMQQAEAAPSSTREHGGSSQKQSSRQRQSSSRQKRGGS